MGRLLLLAFLYLFGCSWTFASIDKCLHAVKCSPYDAVKIILDDPATDLTKQGQDGLTPLLAASYEGREDIVLYLFLTKKADLGGTDQQKRNLLHLAALKGHLGVIQNIGNNLRKSNVRLWEKLLEAQDDLGMTPVHLAAQYGRADVLVYFLSTGINQNMLDGNGKSPLYWALKNKQDRAAEVLIASKRFNINYQSPWGMAALHEGARGGHLDVVQALVEKGANLNIKDVDERTPLYWASERGHPEVVVFLLEQGADPTIMDADRRTILHRAARYGHTAVVKILLSKTKLDVHSKDPLDYTPFCWAVRNGHVETAATLLAAKADINDLTTGGKRIFEYVVKAGNRSMVQLLAHNGFNVDEEDEEGKTALHHAAENGDKEMASLLVTLGADASKKDRSGKTPLDTGASLGTSGVVKVLVAKEGDLKTVQMALQNASKASNTQTMEALLNAHKDNREALKVLLATESVDFYQKNKSGKSLFAYAIAEADIKLLTLFMVLGARDRIISLLREAKANFDTLDKKDHMTLLHYAALMGEPVLAKSIIDAGASVDLPQQDGSTALHNAVSAKSAEVVDVLLKGSASFTAKNRRGETPFTKAIYSKFGDGVVVFLKHGADPSAYVGTVRPQEEAVKSGNTEMVELFMDHVKGDIKALDDFHNKEVLQKMHDDQGMTLVHWIAKRGHSGLLDVVLRLAVRPFMGGIDKTGRTALHYAATGGFTDIIVKLYGQEDSGLDLNTQDNDRRTAMHEAAINHHPDTVKGLLKLEADQTLKDNQGKTALEYFPDGGKKILDELNPPKPQKKK